MEREIKAMKGKRKDKDKEGQPDKNIRKEGGKKATVKGRTDGGIRKTERKKERRRIED